MDSAERKRRPLPRRVGARNGASQDEQSIDVGSAVGHPDAHPRRRSRGRVPRVRDECDRVARAPRRARRHEAGAPPHLVGDARREPPPRPRVREVRARGRRRDGQLPPARRQRDLRSTRAVGAVVLAHRATDRQARQLRFAVRPAGRGSLHRVPAVAARDGDARGYRRRHRRRRAELRRVAAPSRLCCRRASRTCS